MTKKVYKTAHGKTVDMGALILQNENVRAVGNMGVNARGDLLDSNNQVIEKSNQRINKQYAKQVSNVSSAPVNTSTPKRIKEESMVKQEPILDSFEPGPVEAPKTGLAAAMNRAQAAKKSK